MVRLILGSIACILPQIKNESVKNKKQHVCEFGGHQKPVYLNQVLLCTRHVREQFGRLLQFVAKKAKPCGNKPKSPESCHKCDLWHCEHCAGQWLLDDPIEVPDTMHCPAQRGLV